MASKKGRKAHPAGRHAPSPSVKKHVAPTGSVVKPQPEAAVMPWDDSGVAITLGGSSPLDAAASSGNELPWEGSSAVHNGLPWQSSDSDGGEAPDFDNPVWEKGLTVQVMDDGSAPAFAQKAEGAAPSEVSFQSGGDGSGEEAASAPPFEEQGEAPPLAVVYQPVEEDISPEVSLQSGGEMQGDETAFAPPFEAQGEAPPLAVVCQPVEEDISPEISLQSGGDGADEETAVLPSETHGSGFIGMRPGKQTAQGSSGFERFPAVEPDGQAATPQYELTGGTAQFEDFAPPKPDYEAVAVDNADIKPGKKKEKKQSGLGRGTKVIIICAISFAVLVCGATGFLFWWFDPVNRIDRLLDSGDHDGAFSMYAESYASDSDLTRLESRMNKRLGELRSSFAEQAVTFEAAMNELDAIRRMALPGAQAELTATDDYIKSLNESRLSYAEGMTMMESGDYAGAIVNLRKVIPEDADYAAASTSLTEACDRYREQSLTTAASFADNQEYSAAIIELQEALKLLPGDQKLTNQLGVYSEQYRTKLRDDALDSADSKAKSGDYRGAMNIITAVMGEIGTDQKLSDALWDYQNKYIDSTCNKADSLVARDDFNGAIAAIDEALELLPNDDRLIQKRTDVIRRIPVFLNDCRLLDHGSFRYDPGTFTANNGKRYTVSYRFDAEDGGYAEYKLDRRYTQFTGTIVTMPSVDPMTRITLDFYADGYYIYSLSNINVFMNAYDFRIDVTNVDELLIRTSCEEYYGYEAICCIVATELRYK